MLPSHDLHSGAEMVEAPAGHWRQLIQVRLSLMRLRAKAAIAVVMWSSPRVSILLLVFVMGRWSANYDFHVAQIPALKGQVRSLQVQVPKIKAKLQATEIAKEKAVDKVEDIKQATGLTEADIVTLHKIVHAQSPLGPQLETR